MWVQERNAAKWELTPMETHEGVNSDSGTAGCREGSAGQTQQFKGVFKH